MGVIFKNNVMYGAGDIEISPICYSEKEREVGVWMDGKPLYQKTINTGALPSTTDWVSIPHGITNIDKVIKCTGIALSPSSGDDNYYYIIPQYRTTYNVGVTFEISETDINYTQTWLNNVTDSYVTLQYTKTTDTPGSGIWTPQGTPAVHYDGNEKVVGTWFGETLYEKSYQVTGIKGDNVIVDATLTPSAIRPIHIYSSFYTTGGAYQGVSFAHELTNGQFIRVGVSPSQGLFCDIDGYNTNYFGTDGANVYITIQYIKITTL